MAESITVETKTEFHRATTDAQRIQVKEALLKPEVRLAMVFALSLMVENGASQERLAGAKEYRELLLNLSEPKSKPVTYPEKNLKQG